MQKFRRRLAVTAIAALLGTSLIGLTAAPASAASCSATANPPIYISANFVSWNVSGTCGSVTTHVQGQLQRQGTLAYTAIDMKTRSTGGSLAGTGVCNGTTSTYRTWVYTESSTSQIAAQKTSAARSITCR